MRIYLSSRLRERSRMREYRDALEREYHTVTSTWIDGPGGESPEAIAERDIRDLRRANLLLICGHTGRNGGLMAELGIAIERDIKIIHIAAEREPAEVFLHLPSVTWVRSFNAALDMIDTPRRKTAAA